MAFDIEKMKEDGVSSHLIRLVSMNQETLLLFIARRLENDRIFQQFINTEVSSVEAMYPYAVAAGLMSEEDREWLVDEGNPYKPQTYRVTFVKTATLDENIPDYIDVNIGESIILPGTDQTYWFTTSNDNVQNNAVGYGTQSYTPTESITLYGVYFQDV